MIAETNPLLIDLIIQHVVSFLSERDLKSCRLISLKWYLPSTRALQKCSKAISFGSLYKVNLIRLRPDLETIKLFISSNSPSDLLPYLKFDLRPSVFAPNSLPLISQFFYDFGPTIHTLNINLAYESADNFNTHFFPYLDLRGLKSLDFCNTIRGEMRPSLRSELLTTRFNLLENILQAAPNLESLSFWCDSENTVWPGEAIEVLKKVSSNLRNLRDLKISFPMTNFHLMNLSLSLQNLELTSLIFLIREPIFTTEAFYKILETQKNSLVNLKLVDLQCDQVKYVEFPKKMNKLKRLEIEGTFYGDQCQLNLFNFSYKQCPKLASVILRNCHSLNFELEGLFPQNSGIFGDFCSVEVCKSLTELHITLAHDFMNKKWIEMVPKVFPNLRNLHIMFSPEAKDLLVSVFKLGQLEWLTINVRKCGENVDSLLCGIEGSVLKDKFGQRPLEDLSQGDLEGLRSQPGLTSLKNLRCLELKGEYRNYKSETSAITELSVYLALLQMHNLRNLLFFHTGLNLNPECISRLTKRFNFVRIYPEE